MQSHILNQFQTLIDFLMHNPGLSAKPNVVGFFTKSLQIYNLEFTRKNKSKIFIFGKV